MRIHTIKFSKNALPNETLPITVLVLITPNSILPITIPIPMLVTLVTTPPPPTAPHETIPLIKTPPTNPPPVNVLNVQLKKRTPILIARNVSNYVSITLEPLKLLLVFVAANWVITEPLVL